MDAQKTILAFDLHGVVIRMDFIKMFKTWWRFEHKWGFVLHMCNPVLIFKGLRLALSHGTDEELYNLFDHYMPDYVPFVLDVTCCHVRKQDTVEILKELKKAGCQLHITSNIGPRRLMRLTTDMPDVIGLFDMVYTATMHHNGMTKKPHADFFTTYQKLHVPPSHTLVFVDNSKDHVHAARELGITSIRFKNAQQLRVDLTKMDLIQ